MAIHFISIEVRVVGVAIRIVHTNGLLTNMCKNSGFVGHDAWESGGKGGWLLVTWLGC